MDPGTALAVVQIAAKALSLIAEYYSDVKNAKEDVERLRNEILAFQNVVQKLLELIGRQDAKRLPTSTQIVTAIKDSQKDLGALEQKLSPSKKKKAMKRMGFRALAWPFTSKEVEKYIANLERHKATFTLALNTDQL